MGMVLVAVAPTLAAWLPLHPTALAPEELKALEQLQNLRQTIVGGFI